MISGWRNSKNGRNYHRSSKASPVGVPPMKPSREFELPSIKIDYREIIYSGLIQVIKEHHYTNFGGRFGTMKPSCEAYTETSHPDQKDCLVQACHGDLSWCYGCDLETKQQPKELKSSSFPPTKNPLVKSNVKTMLSCFWYHRVLHFKSPEILANLTVNQARSFKKLRKSFTWKKSSLS